MDKNLSWFIGPKAENAKYFSELLELITQDYFHWRKNYFPEDPLLINKSDQRDFNQVNDILNQNINEFLASLRRNFPFYNPRYIAHMLSDTTMAGMLGYFGAMLYNSNNVTPESAPVTTEWEIEVCNSIIKMIGYRPSPKPPNKDASIADWKRYQKELGTEFGWSHITSGGTVANIEALWVARTIKYYPLAIQEVSINNGLNIAIKLPNYSEYKIDDNIKDIKTISKFDLINIKPNESIYLLSRFIQAYSEKFSNLSLESSTKQAVKELNEAEYSLSNNLGKLLTEFPLAIFVSGAAHYSVKKAADILGVGVNNIILIPMDSQFRADIKQLEILMKECLSKKISPLAVIGIAGTTEEGAIDPIDEIVELRNKLEKELCVSFWLHIDAAWGGFIKTIIELSPEEEYRIIEEKVLKKLNLIHAGNKFTEIEDYIKYFLIKISEQITAIRYVFKQEIENVSQLDPSINEENFKTKFFGFKNEMRKLINSDVVDDQAIEYIEQRIHKLALLKFLSDKFSKIKSTYTEQSRKSVFLKISKANNDFKSMMSGLESLILNAEPLISDDCYFDSNDFKVLLVDRIDDLRLYTADEITIQYRNYLKKKPITLGSAEAVVRSFLAFKYSDSITIDPHKLGYVPYPNGIVAFKNDRIRHFIKHDAPYITSNKHDVLLHNPPMHINDIDFSNLSHDNLPYDNYSVAIDAFAPFILEGSKPGAAAAALWLSIKSIPLSRDAHGSIIKNTLLSTRELYEWMISWEKVVSSVYEDIAYEFLSVSPTYPDSNVFVFVLKVKNIKSLEFMNKFVEMVYDRYSIQAEFGDKTYSYAQPFFLSKTTFKSPNYNFSTFKDFFERNGIRNAQNAFEEVGITVLRATLMNPYIYPYKNEGKINLIKDFIISLHRVAKEVSLQIITDHIKQ